MKALLLGQFVNLGGTQYLSYKVIGTLKKAGYEVDVLCGKEHKYFPNAINSRLETNYPYFKEKTRIDILRNIRKLKSELKQYPISNYDLTFNNHPNTFLYKADINYLHGPSFIDTILLPDGTLRKNSLYYILKYKKIYSLYDNANFLTHGKYTKRISENNLPKIGIRPRRIDYIYIPVDINFEVDLNNKEENTVLSFGRIMPDKNIESVLSVARVSSAKFTIAGYVSTKHLDYLKKLEKEKPENVTIIPNPDENTKRDLFLRSWSYMHPKPMEHFGVSAAEAIAYGCVPVVHKSGGVWEDVTESGKFGIGYVNTEEASQKIIESFELSDLKRQEIYESRVRFSFLNFEKKLVDIIGKIIN